MSIPPGSSGAGECGPDIPADPPLDLLRLARDVRPGRAGVPAPAVPGGKLVHVDRRVARPEAHADAAPGRLLEERRHPDAVEIAREVDEPVRVLRTRAALLVHAAPDPKPGERPV